MRILLLPLLSISFLFAASPQQTALIQQIKESEPLIAQSLIDYRVPGLALGILLDGELVYTKGFGKSDLEKGLSVSADTIFQIGSCSKAFTSFLSGLLMEEGKISWDQPLIDLLPQFRLQNSYATLHMTMRDILSHRSGFPRHPLVWYGASDMNREELVQKLRYLDFSTDFRERHHYGDLLYIAAALAMEKVVGKSWEEQIKERVLAPLKMARTGVSLKEMEKKNDIALPYQVKAGKIQRMAFRDFKLIAPAGGLHSTVNDLSKWVSMHLHGGKIGSLSLISPVTLQEMYSPQAIIQEAPQAKEAAISLAGLGWNIIPYRGHYYVSHDGGVDGFTSVVNLLPEEKIGIIVLTNSNLTPLARYLSGFVMDRLLLLPPKDWLQEGLEKVQTSWKLESQTTDISGRKQGTALSHPISHYAGSYSHPGYGTLKIQVIEEGKLRMEHNGLAAILEPWHYDTFILSQELQDLIRSRKGMKFSFQTTNDGEIKSVSATLEPATKEIVFVKETQFEETLRSYLLRFTGLYEFQGHTVEIALRDGVLCGIIPGQPTYELVPQGENCFVIKSMGYLLRFEINASQKVEKITLSLPYGTFSATPKKN
ncbi:MAG: serine hydrolase [Verrucomicrobiota bacterium]|nr:serine hydrolase [Verrucomicrobiota bacterium]